ncbi:MAG: alpha/beta fold hydrolase [Myxococcales bacterium]|nr:alpha/beta fold hydrolase [Myxococcales bacterium]
MRRVLTGLLANGHVQTLGAAAPFYCPPRGFRPSEHEPLRLPIAHGCLRGHLHADLWLAKGRRPAVVIVHGIGGDLASRYVVRAAVALHRDGFHVARMSMRGAGASVAEAPALYHAGLTGDVLRVVEVLRDDDRISSVVLLGFSGGGNLVTKLLGELAERGPSLVAAAATISAPFDYTLIGPHMDAPARLPYRFHVLRGLVRQARAFARLHPDRATFDAAGLSRLGSFREYDAKVVLPVYGFASVDAYWAAASARPSLSRVAVPTRVIHAHDDPMVPGALVRASLRDASLALDLEMSREGGHIGWFAGLDEASFVTPWAVRRATEHLARHAR